MVKNILSSALNPSPTSVYIKIMMNHLQLLMITASFDFEWPDEIVGFFGAISPVATASENLISFDCFLDIRSTGGVDMDANSAPANEIRVEQLNVLVYWLLPWIIAFMVFMPWFIILRKKNQRKKLNARFITTYIFILFLVFPNITQKMVDQFNCQIYDEERRLKVDLQSPCWEGYHWIFTVYIALPGILIYGLGIPAGVLYLMRRDRDRLDTLNVKEKFGFLFNGFKKKYYYWEIAIMYRKALMIFIAVFLNQIGLIVQALVILIVLVVFIQVNNIRRPFADRALNEIENLSLMTSTVTIYCGIFFLSAKDPDSLSFDKNKDFSLNATTSIFLFLLILGSNLLFTTIWVIKFYFIARDMIREKFPRLYIWIFLCCRKDRWVRENIQRAKKEKNESMIAKIEDVQYFMKDMKAMYINHVNYEGHDEFMKLLYIIEDMKPKIDMTIKKNEFKVDGKIARERRFDPEHLNRALDDKKLEVNESFESKGSYSNSESISKNKGGKSSKDRDFKTENDMPQGRDELLSYFENREKIHNINRNHFKIYDVLFNDKKKENKFKSSLEDEKVQQLEDYLKDKFKNPDSRTMFKKGSSTDDIENGTSRRSHRSYTAKEISIEGEEGNTTTNNLVANFNEYETDVGMPHNAAPRLKMSRNAKVLMRTKEGQTSGEILYQIDPKYDLPKGDSIQEEDLQIKDYDSEGNDLSNYSPKKDPKVVPMNELANDITPMDKKNLTKIIEDSFPTMYKVNKPSHEEESSSEEEIEKESENPTITSSSGSSDITPVNRAQRERRVSRMLQPDEEEKNPRNKMVLKSLEKDHRKNVKQIGLTVQNLEAEKKKSQFPLSDHRKSRIGQIKRQDQRNMSILESSLQEGRYSLLSHPSLHSKPHKASKVLGGTLPFLITDTNLSHQNYRQ